MAVSGKFIKKQMGALRPLFLGVSLETSRKAQDKLGELMRYTRRKEITLSFKNFSKSALYDLSFFCDILICVEVI